MPLMEWSTDLSVNVKRFDEQHRELLAIANELHDAIESGKGKEVLGKVLNGLLRYTATHFADEERLMIAHAYPGLADHRREHVKLVGRVVVLKKSFEAGEAVLTGDVMNFLKDWLRNHIQGDDKMYGIFFNSKGVN